MGSIDRRIKELEKQLTADEHAPAAGREQLVREFMRLVLNAMARIRRAPIDPEQSRYSVERLRNESPITLAARVAALERLGHEDEGEAREVLAELVGERDLNPASLEVLTETAPIEDLSEP